jgi:phosphopantothenoylcysteine decarboxylase/phosphopantothenate--cysteine ligase
VTAGPTYERIDPVRFIGNFSTGKMGIAIAERLAARGAEVTLVCGPTHLSTQAAGITTIPVESASELYEACSGVFPQCDVAVLAAAVADYRPVEQAMEKIKKSGNELTLQLTKTEDTLAALGKIKQAHQTLIGFALETNNEMDNARKKLEAKNADLIVLNSLKDEGAGFGHDTNKVTLISRKDSRSLPLMSKYEVADAITEAITELMYAEETV